MKVLTKSLIGASGTGVRESGLAVETYILNYFTNASKMHHTAVFLPMNA